MFTLSPKQPNIQEPFVLLTALFIAGSELVSLPRVFCLEILLMFLGIGELDPDGCFVGLLVSCAVLYQCLSLPKSKNGYPQSVKTTW